MVKTENEGMKKEGVRGVTRQMQREGGGDERAMLIKVPPCGRE